MIILIMRNQIKNWLIFGPSTPRDGRRVAIASLKNHIAAGIGQRETPVWLSWVKTILIH